MKSRFPLFILMLLLASLTAVPCSKASQLGKEMNEADAELNDVYKRVLDGMPNGELKDDLKTAQRAWVAFVEAEVALHTHLYTESKGGIFIRLELTQERIRELKSIGNRDSVNGYGQGKEN